MVQGEKHGSHLDGKTQAGSPRCVARITHVHSPAVICTPLPDILIHAIDLTGCCSTRRELRHALMNMHSHVHASYLEELVTVTPVLLLHGLDARLHGLTLVAECAGFQPGAGEGGEQGAGMVIAASVVNVVVVVVVVVHSMHPGCMHMW